MKNFNLNINGVVTINYNDIIYKCTIQNLEEDGFSINIPIKDGEYLILDNGENLNFEYYTESGGYYEFDADVVCRDIGDNISMYKLSSPNNIRKIQRRNFVRVPIVKMVEYRLSNESIWYKVMVLDLSGGGMKIKADRELKINDRLFINIEASSENIELEAEVKRLNKINNYEYVYGLEFIDINESKQDKIVKEVFLVMRKQREVI